MRAIQELALSMGCSCINSSNIFHFPSTICPYLWNKLEAVVELHIFMPLSKNIYNPMKGFSPAFKSTTPCHCLLITHPIKNNLSSISITRAITLDMVVVVELMMKPFFSRKFLYPLINIYIYIERERERERERIRIGYFPRP